MYKPKINKIMKYLFIELEIQDGERRHTHRQVHTTKCKNINFAAEYYAAHYWGYSERTFGENAWYAHAGEIAIECVDVKELTKSEYDFVYNLFHGANIAEDDTTILYPEKNEPENFSEQEIKDFKKEWGQTHQEICSALCLYEDGAEEFLNVENFWHEEDKMWYPKFSSLFSEREQKIADYLRE
jgi:hypothetical protein